MRTGTTAHPRLRWLLAVTLAALVACSGPTGPSDGGAPNFRAFTFVDRDDQVRRVVVDVAHR